jgi:DNA adenine methylase
MRTQSRKIRPAVKTHGGKAYLARSIGSLLPDHPTYVEPYFEGGSVLLNKPRSEIEVAGDLDSDLIGFYLVLSKQTSELLKRLRSVPYVRESFDWACQPQEKHDPIETAVRFLVRNRFSRGGMGKTFAWSERQRGGQPGDVNGWQTIVEQLPAIARRLQEVQLCVSDGADLIKRFDGPGAVHYLDPPYLPETRTSPKVYAYEMSYEEHERLLDTILNVRGMVALSGYHNPLYDRLLASWKPHEFEMPNHSGQGKTKQRRIEVVWMSPNCDRFELRG